MSNPILDNDYNQIFSNENAELLSSDPGPIAQASSDALRIALELNERGAAQLGVGVRGEFYLNTFDERSVFCPSDAFYFPLDVDARGYAPAASTKTINPITASNLAFDGEGCFVGRSVANLWPVGSLSQFGPSVTAPTIYPELNERLSVDSSTNTFNITTNSLSATAQPYTVSSWVRYNEGALTLNPFLLRTAINTPLTNTPIRTDGGKRVEYWQRAYTSATYTAGGTVSPTISVSMGAGFLAYPMVEAKPFVSAYTPTTRGDARLTFNFNALGILWNTNYTIGYWKKVHGTATNGTTSGTSLDALGTATNTVGGGFRSFGKASTLQHGIVSAPQTTPIADYNQYQYEWMLHIIRREGTTLTYRVYSRTGGLYSSVSISETTTAANRYVTQDGYDLQLGGFNNLATNAANAYYRDLWVVQRAIPDSEFDALWQTKLKAGVITKAGTLLEG